MLFSEEAIGFLFENHTRDSKEWFKEHKADYHRLIEELFCGAYHCAHAYNERY